MKLNIITGILLALLLSAGVASKADAQSWRWYRWGKCGYPLCKEDNDAMKARGDSCHSCCFHHGWGWRYRDCGSCAKAECCHHEGHKYGDYKMHDDGKMDEHKGMHYYHGHRHFRHWDRDRYYYRGGGY